MAFTWAEAQEAMAAKPEPRPFSYGDKDVMLYALGIGMGHDPMDERELAFCYERTLKVVPTAATVLASGAGGRRGLPINYAMILHGEQRLTVHRPLAPKDELTAESSLVGVVDKGKEKGALLFNETVWRDAKGQPVVTLGGTTFARGDGGFGGPTEGGPRPHSAPERAPDKEVALATRPEQALIYRLNGDRNPLHSDPEAARKAGFARPILHGLCTYGVTCRAVLQAYCDFEPARLKAFDVRFSSPVYPGETIVTRLWKDGETVSFEAAVAERPGVTVIKGGRAVVSA
jgi:acyl dehydratase